MTREYQLGLELQDRTQELETISGISRELQAVSDIESVCSTLLKTLQRLYPRECLSILLAGSLDEGSVPEVMVVKAERGYREEWSPVGQVLKMTPGGRGAVLRAVYSARPVNIRDTGQTIDYVANQEGTASELVVPMISQGRIVGVIDLQSPVAYRYESDDVRRIQKIAEQAAGAVEGALMQDELFDMARRDRLTGLHNLRYFEEKYAEEFDRASRYGYPFSLIVLDIDDFKVYNDTFGHPMGNLLLKRLTVAVRSALREVDIPVRYGGEEFVCILPLTDIRVAEEVAERIRQRVLDANPDIPHAETQPGGCVSVSLGVASFPVDSRERDELFEMADQRMYSAKRAGKNRVCAR
jgi:diguanylate cyclase (GGDEF)-like protein